MTHSIMFHHFHNENHLPAQGSLSSDDFAEMLDWLAQRYKILSAFEFLEQFESGNLDKSDICLSFDDALLCQWDVAVPVLQKLKIQAFFFVHSSVFSANPDFLEIFRYFRCNDCYMYWDLVCTRNWLFGNCRIIFFNNYCKSYNFKKIIFKNTKFCKTF